MTPALTPSSIIPFINAAELRPATESLAPVERILRVAEIMPMKRNGHTEVVCTHKL